MKKLNHPCTYGAINLIGLAHSVGGPGNMSMGAFDLSQLRNAQLAPAKGASALVVCVATSTRRSPNLRLTSSRI